MDLVNPKVTFILTIFWNAGFSQPKNRCHSWKENFILFIYLKWTSSPRYLLLRIFLELILIIFAIREIEIPRKSGFSKIVKMKTGNLFFWLLILRCAFLSEEKKVKQAKHYFATWKITFYFKKVSFTQGLCEPIKVNYLRTEIFFNKVDIIARI